jgi:hypothetical protein
MTAVLGTEDVTADSGYYGNGFQLMMSLRLSILAGLFSLPHSRSELNATIIILGYSQLFRDHIQDPSC